MIKARDIVAYREMFNVFPERFNLSREIAAQDLPLWFSYAKCDPQGQPEPLHRIPKTAHLTIGFCRFRRPYLDQHFIVHCFGFFYIPELQNVRWPVSCVSDGFHVFVSPTVSWLDPLTYDHLRFDPKLAESTGAARPLLS